jgi:hypothetical protein
MTPREELADLLQRARVEAGYGSQGALAKRHRKRVRPRAGCAEPIRVRWQRDEHRGGSERGADGSRARPTPPRRC